MLKNSLREEYGDGIGTDDVYKKIAEKLNPAIVDGKMSRGWQWKFDLWKREFDKQENRWDWVPNVKTKFDLYEELRKAPPEYFYEPSPTQLAAHKSGVRTKQVAGGWRVGKSTWLAAEILPYCFHDNAEIWVIANTYQLPRYEFMYLYHWLRWLDCPITRFNDPGNGMWRLDLAWGAKLETHSCDDVTTIEGGNLDCVGVAEAGLVDEGVIRRLSGRVAEKRGPVLMSGSLDASQNWYMESFSNFLNGPIEDVSWHSFGVPSWENKVVFPKGEQDEQILHWKATLTEDEYKLKVCAEVAKPSELVFPEFREDIHIVNFEYSNTDQGGFKLEYPEPIMDDIGVRVKGFTLPNRGDVMLAIDPGYAGAYAVLACRKYDEDIYVLDEVYVRREVVEEVIAECKTRWWWPHISYAVIDIAGKQHQAMTSQIEIWSKQQHLGFPPRSMYVPIPDGIQRLRTFLKNPLNGRPRIYFSRLCKNTAKEFSLYRYRLSKENRPEREEPVDRDNHAIKALTYLLMDRFGPSEGRGKTISEKYVKNYNVAESYIRRTWSPIDTTWWGG